MRLRVTQIGLCLALSAVLLGSMAPFHANAQNPDTLMPEQSAAKSKELLKQLINTMGGPAYLNARQRECSGRRAQFGHSGGMMGFVDFKDYWRYPDTHRTDYSKKGNIVDLFSGDHGWTLDRSGVSDEPDSAIADFRESLKRNIDNLLRVRLKEPDLLFHYGGIDIVDMKPIDWVEITDSEQRTFRLAIEQSTHLLARSIVVADDENMHQRSEDATIYTNYQNLDGIQTPLQITRERDGRKVYQAFLAGCKYNSGIPDDFFTKAALEKRYAEVGNKKDKEIFKNSRDKTEP